MLTTVPVVRTKGGTNTVNIYGFLHHGSWFPWLLGIVCVALCKSCLRSHPPRTDHCPQVVTTQINSTPCQCCAQWEGSVHRDLYFQSWGPCCCKRETDFGHRCGNTDLSSFHYPVLFSTPQSWFLCYPLTYMGPHKTSFCLACSERQYVCSLGGCWKDHRVAHSLTKQAKATTAVGVLGPHVCWWRARNSILKTNQSF